MCVPRTGEVAAPSSGAAVDPGGRPQQGPWSLDSKQTPQDTHFPRVHLVKASGRASKDFRDWGWFIESLPEGGSCEVTLEYVGTGAVQSRTPEPGGSWG